MMYIRQAIPADLHTVVEIIHCAADKLHAAGYDQWPRGSPNLMPDSLAAQIERGETYLVTWTGEPVATIAVSARPDPDFWTADEAAEPARYLSKAAVSPARAGQGIGDLTMRRIVDQAAADGAKWARVDVWRTNRKLQDYYRTRGWTYLRTEAVPGRRSGALFQRPAVADLEAREALPEREPPAFTGDDRAALYRDTWLPPGTPVITAAPGGPVAATIVDVIGPDYGAQITTRAGEFGSGRPPVMYTVTRRGHTWTVAEGSVWPDPDRILTGPASHRF